MLAFIRKSAFGHVALGLCCAAVLTVSCAPTVEEIQEEFDEFLAERNQCTAALECTLVYPGCPLGCAVGVRKEHAAETRDKAQELIDEYESSGEACEYSCMAVTVDCVDGRCQAIEAEPL